MDPFGSMQGFMTQLRSFMRNPMQLLMQKRLGLPQNINVMQNPGQAIQHLMNTGAMSQQQYNELQEIARQIQNNQQFLNQFMNR